MDKKTLRHLLINGIDPKSVENVQFVEHVSNKMMEILQLDIGEVARTGIKKEDYIQIVREEIFKLCDKDADYYKMNRRRLKRGTITITGALYFCAHVIKKRCRTETSNQLS